MILSLASPVWGAEETKRASAHEAKIERKAFARSSEEIGEVQEALKNKGQDPGAIDGTRSEKTQAALKAFQEANRLRVTGRLNKQTAQKLGLKKYKTLAKV